MHRHSVHPKKHPTRESIFHVCVWWMNRIHVSETVGYLYAHCYGPHCPMLTVHSQVKPQMRPPMWRGTLYIGYHDCIISQSPFYNDVFDVALPEPSTRNPPQSSLLDGDCTTLSQISHFSEPNQNSQYLWFTTQ